MVLLNKAREYEKLRMNYYGILVSRLDIRKNEICNRMRYQL